MALDGAALREDFPLLSESEAGRGLHYLDNAATTQKPQAVIDALVACYREYYGPVHRGLYPLAEAASEHYEDARRRIAGFIGAARPESVVFTRSATESINLVAEGWARQRLGPDDQVWVTRMEHHANFLPWQRICKATGAGLRIVEVGADGRLELAAAEAQGLYAPSTRIIALCHVSNVLGAVNPVEEVVAKAQARGIAVLVDAAQSVAHMCLDVEAMGCDFLAFSGHKMYGPGGIGVLYARPDRLDEIEPLLVGGGMVDEVYEDHSSWALVPARLEAGSPNLADACALAAAARYLQDCGMARVQAHLQALGEQARAALAGLDGVQVYGAGDATRHSGIVSFSVEGVHPHDLAQVAGEHGVAIRAGHHCCQPLMAHLGVAATARASFGVYNGADDVAALVEAIAAARELFKAG